MKYKVAELQGVLLDAAVAMAEGIELLQTSGRPRAAVLVLDGGRLYRLDAAFEYSPSTDMALGGEIIERERITLGAPGFMKSGLWEAFIEPILDVRKDDIVGRFEGSGQTLLIAAMRAYVASKFGDTFELP